MRFTDFDIYKDLLLDKSGLVIEHDQSFLLDSRLMPIAKKWGYSSLEAMTATLNAMPDKNIVQDVIDAMAEKDTCFFRDTWPFRMLGEEILPALKKKRGGAKKFRAWCAASGTGQEPYSLCLTILDRPLEFSGWKMEVLATDISTDSLERAKNGVYSQFEVQRGVPVRALLRHFKQVDSENWQISPEIRRMVKHQPFNLLDSMTGLGRFDVILCRNVLKGFAPKTRQATIEKLCAQMEKDGVIVFGKGEKPESGLLHPLHEGRGVYGLKG